VSLQRSPIVLSPNAGKYLKPQLIQMERASSADPRRGPGDHHAATSTVVHGMRDSS